MPPIRKKISAMPFGSDGKAYFPWRWYDYGADIFRYTIFGSTNFKSLETIFYTYYRFEVSRKIFYSTATFILTEDNRWSISSGQKNA